MKYKEYLTESINIDQKLKDKVVSRLIKGGYNTDDSKQMVDDYITKALSIWPNSKTPAQLADKISWLWSYDD